MKNERDDLDLQMEFTELGPPGHKSGIVAIIGPPNAGKSTLLNHFLGQKVAIVTPKPQTTRNRISGILSLEKAQVVFLDTPGVHQGKKTLNRFLVEAAWQALLGAHGVLLMLDGALYAAKPGLLERDLGHMEGRLKKSGLPLLIALNKIDKVKDKKGLLPVLERIGERFPDQEIFPVSAVRGQGTERLLESVLDILPQAPPVYPPDQISTVPLRFMAAETVREKLFLRLKQELPYGVAVDIEDWSEEPERNLVHIAAVIYVASKSHKPIVIGKGGQMLKHIGQEARQDLEELLDQRVNLQLWVKVRPRWDEDRGFMSELGLGT